MSATIVIQKYLQDYQTNGTTLIDLAFDNMTFLYAKEPIISCTGQRESKSYYDENNKEAIRITYDKIEGIYVFNGVEYSNEFLGVQKTIHFMNWSDEIAYSKKMQGYYFNLEPIFIGDGTETIIGFTSAKRQSILKQERYSADEYLNAKNPVLYRFLYAQYSTEYQYYLRTGIKDNLVIAIKDEISPSVLDVLNHNVYGTIILIRDLILNSLR